MTTSRVIRGTRARIVFYVIGLVVLVTILAIYNNTVSQLDDVKKSNEICHQQEETLSSQLQVISEYKQRLEKSLKTEKAEHQQMKHELEVKYNEEKIKHDKTTKETMLKFNSLQQHCKILQTQHDDFKEDCSKTKEKQLNEINDLQLKLKELQQQLKKLESVKESLKSQYLTLQVENERLEGKVKGVEDNKNENESKINHLIKINHELTSELESLREKCPSYDTLKEPEVNPQAVSPANGPSFNKQVEVSPSQYQIRDSENKPAANNVGELPPAQEKQEKRVLALPSGNSDNKLSSSTKSTTSSGLKVSKGSLNGARPLLLPTLTPESVKKDHIHFEAPKDIKIDETKKKLPEGVVDAPNVENNELPNDLVFNSRYRNKIDGDKIKPDDVEKENGANEVFDGPMLGAQDGQNYDRLGFVGNEAIKQAESVNFEKQHIDALHNNVEGKNKKMYDQVDYKDLQNDVQLEDNAPDEDDDPDDYNDHLAKQRDPAVRN